MKTPFLALALLLLTLTACGADCHEPVQVAQPAPEPVAAPVPVAEPVAVEAPQPRIALASTKKPSRDMRAEAAKYIGYYNSYKLTPEQAAIKTDALSRMPAPCCSDNTMATCCCPCNMAKAVWGYSAYLIVEKGYDADRLEKAARQWLADANPNGSSGQACYTGGCSRSFDQDGCGGMVEGYIF